MYITLVTMRMHGAIIKHAYPYLYLEGQRTSLSSLVHMEADRKTLPRANLVLLMTDPPAHGKALVATATMRAKPNPSTLLSLSFRSILHRRQASGGPNETS